MGKGFSGGIIKYGHIWTYKTLCNPHVKIFDFIFRHSRRFFRRSFSPDLVLILIFIFFSPKGDEVKINNNPFYRFVRFSYLFALSFSVFIYLFIHMCIHCLGHFSPHVPHLLPLPLPSLLPGRTCSALFSNFVEEKTLAIIKKT
jgi:hypothetical protein